MREFDELSAQTNDLQIDIDEYFNDMELSKEEKEKRKEFSRSMEEAMLFIFALFSIMREYDYMNKQYIISQLEIRYSAIVLQYMNLDKAIEGYIQKFSEEIVDTTLKYADEEYYLSGDRAVVISVNESNSILGYRQLQEAKENGYTKKTWITERDNRVRKTHREVDSLTIPIDNLFPVGNSLMMYPHDFSAEPKEVCGCRCSIKYS